MVILPSDRNEELRECVAGTTKGLERGRRWARNWPDFVPEQGLDTLVWADEDDCHFDSRLGLVYPV